MNTIMDSNVSSIITQIRKDPPPLILTVLRRVQGANGSAPAESHCGVLSQCRPNSTPDPCSGQTDLLWCEEEGGWGINTYIQVKYKHLNNIKEWKVDTLDTDWHTKMIVYTYKYTGCVT